MLASRPLAAIILAVVAFSAPAKELAHVEAHHRAGHQQTEPSGHDHLPVDGSTVSSLAGGHQHTLVSPSVSPRTHSVAVAAFVAINALTFDLQSRTVTHSLLRATPPRAGPGTPAPARPRAPPLA